MLLFMLSMCLSHIFLYIFIIYIGFATLYHLSVMYVTVYNMSFNSNCHILAAELNYRFTKNYFWYCFGDHVYIFIIYFSFLIRLTYFLMLNSKMQCVFGGRMTRIPECST